VIETQPRTNASIAIVWTDWWPGDSESSARRAAKLIDPTDDRVRHYYEPARLLGKEVARSLSWADADADENAAWDIYLFYSAGARWHDALPPPETVLHQLSRRQNDSGFRTGDELVDALREATTRTLAAPGGG
jgi:hypothetical protein